MAKKWSIVGSVKGRGGKHIGTRVRNNSTGKTRTLLNPHGKYGKATVELKQGVRMTNEGEIKRDRYGKLLTLTKGQRAYRAGYRSAVIDQTKAYNANQNLKEGRK